MRNRLNGTTVAIRKPAGKRPVRKIDRILSRRETGIDFDFEWVGQQLVVTFRSVPPEPACGKLADEILNQWREAGSRGDCVLDLTALDRLDATGVKNLSTLLWRINVPGRRIVGLVGSGDLGLILRHAHLDRSMEIVEIVRTNWDEHSATDTVRVARVMTRRLT